jgi:acyl dehydratase
MNADLEGRTYPAISFTVDAEHVRRFAAAVGDAPDPVPPTFVTAAEIVSGLDRAVADPDLDLDFARVVHGEQEFEWFRPMRVGETLTVSTSIESVRTKGGHGFLTLRTEVLDAAGGTVVIARSAMIERGNA